MTAKEYIFYTVDNFKKNIGYLFKYAGVNFLGIVNFPDIIGNDVLSLLDLRKNASSHMKLLFAEIFQKV